MIGTTFLDLVKIRTVIALIRSITPLSILYTISLPFIPSAYLTLPVRIASIYPICETAFYLLVYLPRKYSLQGAAEHPPLPPIEERRQLFEKIHSTIPDHNSYLRRWFHGAELSEIKRENMKEFLRWSLFNASGSWSEEEGGAQEEEELEEYLALVEKGMGRKFEDGRGTAECYRLTIDEVRMKHRPLAWFAILGAIDIVTYIRLSYYGFSYYRPTPFLSNLFSSFPLRLENILARQTAPPSVTTPYWYRSHLSKTHKPILYIHGIGIGLHPYIPTFSLLASTLPDVGILIVEILPVSARLCSPMLNRDHLLTELETILKHHNFIPSTSNTPHRGFILTSNSYGTIPTTHLLHHPSVAPHIKSTILIDPVSILLHLPDVAHNFLRRPPRRANEHMLHYFASTDPMTAHTLCRRFFWAENVLWKEDLIGKNAVVYLGERDLIVDTASVRRYLTETRRSRRGEEEEFVEFNGRDEWVREDKEGGRLKVVWCRGMDHAQLFDERGWYGRIVADVAEAATGGVD